MKKELSRRNFVQFITGAATTAILPISLLSCQKNNPKGPFPYLAPTSEDNLILAKGLSYKLTISWDNIINPNGDRFGFNNDYIACLPYKGKADEALMWVNHEYVNDMFVSKSKNDETKSKKQVDLERAALGGTILKIKRGKDGSWFHDKNSPLNKRVDGRTNIPFISKRPIENKMIAEGTMGGCAGGVTPWGTVLSCEENVQHYYGDQWHKNKPREEGGQQWSKYYNNPPEHYGWVVEIDLETGKAKKHVALGRFAHESATVVKLSDERVVVYSGDDAAGEHLYKFIGSIPNSLEDGELFVADTVNGKWLSLDIQKSKKLQKVFKDQTEVLTYCREASKLLGATPLDRPEDIEVHPQTGDVFLTLTNNKNKLNFFGSIMKLSENKSNHESLEFYSSNYISGGEESGVSAPDNLVFDKKGNLWVATDMSGRFLNKYPYSKFKNNGLFYIPMTGEFAGQAFQIASAPVEAELTGLCFSPDAKSLFLSVQHPGERSKSMDKLSSHWPEGGTSVPKPSVVEISGPLLEKLLGS